MATEKIYIGTGKLKEFPDGGSILRFSFRAEDLDKLRNHMNNGWVAINISKRREPSEKGATHYATIDMWRPKEQAEAAPEERHPTNSQTVDDTADTSDGTSELPF